jgi:histone-binding protein RBBP4
LDAVLPLPPRLAAAAAASGGAVLFPSMSVSSVAPHRARSTARAACRRPQRPYTVPTKMCVDEVHVYHLGDGYDNGKSDAAVVLRGHEAEGYGLSWSPTKEGL